MRITIIFLLLPCFFNVLLASPLPGWGLPQGVHDILKHIVGPPKRFEGCTPEQEKAITEAERHAIVYVKDSLLYLKTYREDAPRYKKWFGHPTEEGWKSLQNLFKKIDEYIPHGGVYICDPCKEEEYTYSRAIAHIGEPDELSPKKRVYICPLFWESPLVGPPRHSQAGIIVHEWSHSKFNDDIGGTLDYESTEFGCVHWLPVHQIQWALKNAYSIQFFAVNDPCLG